MLRQELERLLQKGEAFDNVVGIHCGRDAMGKRIDITLRLRKVDPPNHLSPMTLSEMPKYLAHQQVIAENPYEITFGTSDGVVSCYMRDLEAVEVALKQRGKSLEDVELLVDFWEP
jgi:hypothetical protein